jgi:hypothetical protein
MSTSLTPSVSLAGSGGGPKAIKASHLDDSVTLRGGEKSVVFDEQVPADKAAWFGHGHEDLPTGVARKYADLIDAAGNAVEGDIFVRVMDSSGDEVLGQRRVGDVGTLADAADEQRTERPAQPAMGPHANPHRRLQVVVSLDEGAASDGSTVDTGASSMRLWRTESN